MPNFPAAGPVRLVIKAAVANLAVRTGDVTEAAVEVRPSDPGRKRDVTEAAETVVSGHDGEVTVLGPETSGMRKPGSIDIAVTLPAGSHVHGTVSMGRLRAEGRLGSAILATEVGEIAVAEAATVDLRATTGHIAVGRVAGDATIVTVTGDVRLGEITAGEVSIEATQGNVTVGVAEGSSVSTDVTVTFGRLRDAVHRTAGGSPVKLRAAVQLGEIDVHTAVSPATGV